jgi:hypothetical protein
VNRRWKVVLTAGALAAASLGCAILSLPTALRHLLLADAPLAGENQADPAPTDDEIAAWRADAADGHVALSGTDLARLGGASPDARVYELVVGGGALRCRLSSPVEARWLNVESTVVFAVSDGHVTTARIRALRIGALDFGGLLGGWDAARWTERQLTRMNEEDPTLAARLAAIAEARLVGDRLEVALAPGWEQVPGWE